MADESPRSNARIKAQFGFVDRSKYAGDRGGIGRGGRRRRAPSRRRRAKLKRGKAASAGAADAVFLAAASGTAPSFSRARRFRPATKSKGPAIIIEPHQTVVVEHGWQAALTAKNHLVLRRVQKLERARAIGTKADPVMLEVFNNLFMSIAEQMGVALQNTAYSVNIKERLDFSCAVFDGAGSLVANAPHMPVHLGSMDRAVETVIRKNQGKIRPGDVLRHQRAL